MHLACERVSCDRHATKPDGELTLWPEKPAVLVAGPVDEHLGVENLSPRVGPQPVSFAARFTVPSAQAKSTPMPGVSGVQGR